MPRPLTHDLMRTCWARSTSSVERVIITELRASTYYAELHLVRGNERTVVSSRPSDAVAVAVRTETPLFVSDELMESEGIILALDTEDEEEDTPDELVGPVPPVPRLRPAGGLRGVSPRLRALALVAGAGLASRPAAAARAPGRPPRRRRTAATTTTRRRPRRRRPRASSTTSTRGRLDGVQPASRRRPGQGQGAAGTITGVHHGHQHRDLDLHRRRVPDHGALSGGGHPAHGDDRQRALRERLAARPTPLRPRSRSRRRRRPSSPTSTPTCRSATRRAARPRRRPR